MDLHFSEMMKRYEDFLCADGISDDEITKAEQSLSLRFAQEFREYLSEFGIAYANKHEFTGISKSKSLNIVYATNHERELNADIPNDWYVIEQLNIDGIVIWQSSTGEIYQTSPNANPRKICNSLVEYIDL